ncbi:MAG: hypothetical protein KZQ57_03635 [gamma proteobacterium symbiont of Lucinoma myriamae]|nr:hypothetical protein [gamma proteobacterium symbiont of Lucinoma myriamae]
MNSSGKKTLIVLGGMYVSLLVLFALILSPAVAAINVQLTEQPLSLSESTSIILQKPSQVVYGAVHSKEDVIVQTEDISDVFEKTSNFELSSFVGSILNQLTRSPMAIVLLGLCLFISLVWLFRREETEFIEIKATKFNIESEVFIEGVHAKVSNEALTDKFYSNTDNTLCDKNFLPLIEEFLPLVEDSLALVEDSKANIDASCNRDIQTTKDIAPGDELSRVLEQDDEEKGVFSGNIIPDQVNINKFIRPDKKNAKRKRKNVLEAAFGKEIYSNNIGFIHEEEQLIKNIDSIETFLLNSVDEIRFVNEETRNLKIDAFINMTRAEKITDEMLSHDVDKIKSSEKIDVFIQEFEDILSNLTSHITAINNAPDELENLLQFKLSIHFINVLSKMIQAAHLTQFSTTVIEFLEDILDGNTRMTADVTNHLVVVVNFYERYIHLLKENSSDKIAA